MGGNINKAFAGIALIALGTIANAQGIRMSIQQIWSGLDQSKSNPYYALIDNIGPNTNGIISTDDYGSKSNIQYPVELPSGSKKRVLFSAGSYTETKVILRTPYGTKEAPIKGSYNSEQSRFGLISDNPSDLIFLKAKGGGPEENAGRIAVGVGGCTPDDAPDRSFGYDCLDTLVLGDGTEKLRDEQVRAIKLFVHSGGSLVFVGGASQSASNDIRWKDILPISNPKVSTKTGLTEMLGAVRQGSIQITVTKGSCFGRSYGAGIVSFLSVNPFESPIRESEDRRSIMMKSVRWNHKQNLRKAINKQIGQEESDYDRYSAPSSTTYSSTYRATASLPGSNPYSMANTDPFQIKPPSLANIMWILIGYAIAVVPINFLILKKLKRMEIAWISTPVISVIFSMVLLNSTIGLYKANASTRTTALAILAGNSDDSLVFGKSEMFFPRAKSYNLELKDVQAIMATSRYDRNESGSMNLMDDGRNIIAPDVQTSNLAFKELGYIQTNSELRGLTIALVNKDGQPCIKIVNGSKLKLTNIQVCGPGIQETLPETVAGGSTIVKSVRKIIRSKADSKHPESMSSWQEIASTSPNKLVLLGTVDSMHIGPGYGVGHPGSRYMILSIPLWEETHE